MLMYDNGTLISIPVPACYLMVLLLFRSWNWDPLEKNGQRRRFQREKYSQNHLLSPFQNKVYISEKCENDHIWKIDQRSFRHVCWGASKYTRTAKYGHSHVFLKCTPYFGTKGVFSCRFHSKSLNLLSRVKCTCFSSALYGKYHARMRSLFL